MLQTSTEKEIQNIQFYVAHLDIFNFYSVRSVATGPHFNSFDVFNYGVFDFSAIGLD